jgi:hypothetical protein
MRPLLPVSRVPPRCVTRAPSPIHVRLRIHHLCLAVVFILAGSMVSGCYTFSSFQSAKLLEEGEIELTPSFGTTKFEMSGESAERVSDYFGIQLAHGASEKTNMRFRFERNEYARSSGAMNFIGFEPKVRIVEDVFAFSFPIAVLFTDEFVDDGFQFQPSFHETIPINQHVEANFSQKILIFPSLPETLLALTIGAGLSTDLNRWAIRPEFGVLFPEGDGTFFSFGLGWSIRLTDASE